MKSWTNTLTIRIQIKIQNVLQLERYGSNFQIQGESVIVEDWTRCMRWPNGVAPKSTATAAPRKKKRIICDDDDDEEDPKPVASGLVMKETVDTKPQPEQPEISINAIKQSLGVDTAQLENARCTLENEEAETRREAELLDAELNATEKLIRKKYKALKRLLLSPDADPALLWNARELLREEYMQAGDLLLWNDPVTACRYFEQANAIVKSQTADDAFLQQNLRLLQAQAQLNMGIALIQIAERGAAQSNPMDRAGTLRDACSVLPKLWML